MTCSPTFRNTSIRCIAMGVLAAALVLPGSPTWAHDESPEVLEAILHGLEDAGDITEVQHLVIDTLYFELGQEEALHQWLNFQQAAGLITIETHGYIVALLHLEHVEPAQAMVEASYTGNGNVTLLGHVDPQPPNPYWSDNSSTGQLYNGVWGYVAGSREYALQTNSGGLHILDVTDPATAYRVQFISMPGGQVWRDADVHEDLPSGKTYAYIGAQSGGNLWVVDLSALSGGAPHGVDSDPIPPAAIADRGRTNYGHTVSVNDGLLFMNSANSSSTLGCQIFDLDQDPFDPPLIASWSGSQNDCHDSFARTNVPGSGSKDLLYSADGYSRSYRILDITSVRTGGSPTLVGQTATVSGIYGHSGWLTEDSRYYYAFDEFNVHDIAVYDVSDPASPTLVNTFQYSGDGTDNARVHNCQVRGSYLLAGYYEAGFRVFDISNPANAVEVGKWETWRDPDGDDIFDEVVAGNFDGAWNLYAFLPSGNVLVSDMKSGTYIFRVDPVAVPASPGSLQATAGDAEVDLTWSAVAGATGYSVGRSTASGGPYTSIATQVVGTSFTDTGLTNGTAYYYVASATNAGGESGGSNEVSATPFVQPGCDVEVDFDAGGAAGWTNSGASSCSTGTFVVATPTQQSDGVITQVGGDHTTGTGNAYFSATNTSVGNADVDGGVCIVESPVYPVATDSDISIWYFHGQRDPGDDAGDFFLLEISTDGGSNYSPLVSIGDVVSAAAWTEATTSVTAGDNVVFRVQVADGSATGDIVEAGVDDLAICSNAPPCVTDPDCDDGLYCNGAETCDAGSCQAGTPVACDDGVACTTDFCDEAADACDATPDDGACDNGAFCDGAETCDAVNDCQAGTPVACDDGVGCTVDFCNEAADACDATPDNGVCGNGVFCDGAEVCDPVLGCQIGGDPCPGELCDEGGGVCVQCFVDGDCDDGLFCNGAETCAGGACQAGSDPCPGQSCDEAGDQCIAAPQAQLEWGTAVVGGSAVTVSLAQAYFSPVVVTSVQYANNTTPVVTRISSVTPTSFDVRLQNPSGGAVAAESVSYLVVEEGTWTVGGVAIEAQTTTSTVTDENSSWVGEAQGYGQAYTSPVVLGQVMSTNDPAWSVFWNQGSSRTNPPSASALRTGKEVAEDPSTTRADETVGFVVIEAGHGTIGGVEYESALGVDLVRGITNAPPYTYTFSSAFAAAPAVAVVTMAGMDGGNGGWAYTYGASPATASTLDLAIDEDQVNDSERNHTPEQVGYVVFQAAGVYP